MRAEDGSHLSAAADAQQQRLCEVCGGELGLEQWWVTHYPAGVHTRCRSWSEVAFPYARHLKLLRRMRFSLDGEAQEFVMLADQWLRGMERGWPKPGAEGVLKAALLLRRLRSRLAALHVEPRLVNQL